MPPLIVAAVAALATIATTAVLASGVLGFVITGFAAAAIAAAVGLVVSFGLTSLLHLNKNKHAPNTTVDQQQLIRAATEPRRIIYGEARVGGTILYAASSGEYSEYLHLVIAIAAHPCHSIGNIWFDDQLIQPYQIESSGNVWSGTYTNVARIKKYLGDQTAADSDLVSESPDGWSSNHKLLGITYLYVRLKYNSSIYQGIPNITCLVEGKNDIYDPRSSSTGYTMNWALCVRDYLKADFGLACADAEIDSASFIAAANLSDEAVAEDESGATTQPRYQISGTFTLDQTPIDIIDSLMAAGAGALTYVQGAYQLFGGAYASASASLGMSDFAGTLEVTTQPPRSQLFNSIKGTFTDKDKNWITSDYPPMQFSSYITADGSQIWRQIDHPWITNAIRAQRLSKQMLLRSRHGITVKVPLRYASLTLCGWDVVALTVPDLGWTSKPFRIVAWEYDPARGQCSASLQEEQATDFSWTYDAAAAALDTPSTTLTSPLGLPQPNTLVLSSTTQINADGSVLPALQVTWAEAYSAFVNANEVQWRQGSGDPWHSMQVAVGVGRAIIMPVQMNADYDVQVRAIGGLVYGPFTSIASITIGTHVASPPVPTGASCTGVQGGFTVQWTNPTNTDFDRVWVQASADGGSTWTTMAQTKASYVRLSGFNPDDVRSFQVAAVDTSGNFSSWVSAGAATVPRLVTNDLASGSFSSLGVAQAWTTQSLTRPGSGYSMSTIVSTTVTLAGDARVSIRTKLPAKLVTWTATGGGSGSTGGADSGGGGGGASGDGGGGGGF
jgi:hypothetical protein